MKKNLYDILGVAQDADADTIRKAYRKLAREHHPDVNPGDSESEERFKEISQAYSVLSDAEKRSHYDEFGDVSLEGGFDPEAARRARDAFGARFGGPDVEFGGGGAEFHFGDLDDLLGGVFSRFGRSGGGTRGPARGRDLEASITLSFLAAARGGEHRLSLARPAADGGVRQEQVTVRTPAGVRDGGRIRLAGKGGEALGGPPGDLFLNVHVEPHPVFRREDRDVHLEVPISVTEAVRGAKVEIPTLEGRATVTIPAGTDSGLKLRLRGKGLANPAGGTPGDLIATVRIRVPRDVDEAAEKALDELARHDPPDLREELFR